jgi:hypothetical protein
MADATADVTVSVADGWKLLATAPATTFVKPHATGRAWFLAISAGAPAADLLGLPMGRFSGSGEDNEYRRDTALAGNVYVRIPATSVASAEAADNKMIFSVATS